MLLTGYTKDKEGNAIAGAGIEVKDAQFQTIYQVDSLVLFIKPQA